MLSKNQVKYVQSLRLAKFREEKKVFLAEGNKLVNDVLNSNLQVTQIYGTRDWLDSNTQLSRDKKPELFEVTDDELKKISNLVTPNEVLAVVNIPETGMPDPTNLGSLVLYLDRIQDPGNLGTIIRTADWFGIRNIFCSPGSADVFNPKVVQATMGSICRVKIHYLDLGELIDRLDDKWKIYGTVLDGKNIYRCDLLFPAVIVIGNESKGISGSSLALLTHRVGIPSFSEGADSLNASVATGIILSEFNRQSITDVK